MATRTVTYTIRVHEEDGTFWAEVLDLPGCFAAGDTLNELYDALEEGIGLYLSEDDHEVEVHLEREVSEERRTFELVDA